MNIIKKALVILLTASMFVSCSTSTIVDPDNIDYSFSTDTLGARTGASYSQTRTEENPFRVGIIQYGSHKDLDDCFIGIKHGLDMSDLNISFEYQNGSFNTQTTENIAKKMIEDGYDVIIPISTPSAIASYNAGTYSQTPIVFSAVSNPIESGILNSLTTPNGLITGTATPFNVEEQLNLIQTMQPNIKSIGVVYSLIEPNSLSQLNELRSEATKRGIEIVSAGFSSPDDIIEATYSIVTRVEAITNLTDNNVTYNLSQILEIANLAEVPVYGATQHHVDMGCVAGQGLDYNLVGQKTADIAINILLDKDISKMPVTVFENSQIYFNDDVLEFFDMKIPAQYLDDDIISIAS